MNKGLFCFLTNPREINIDKDPVNYLPHTQKNTNCSLESPFVLLFLPAHLASENGPF